MKPLPHGILSIIPAIIWADDEQIIGCVALRPKQCDHHQLMWTLQLQWTRRILVCAVPQAHAMDFRTYRTVHLGHSEWHSASTVV